MPDRQMVIQWLRKLLHLGEHSLTEFEREHYAKFEQAVEESDCVAYIWDNQQQGGVIILKGNIYNPVTAFNLVSFYKLNRASRRKLKGEFINEPQPLTQDA